MQTLEIRKRPNFDLQFALDQIAESRQLNGDKSYEFSSFGEVHTWESYLVSALDFGEKSDAFAQAAISKLIHNKQRFLERDFLSNLNKVARDLDDKRAGLKAVFAVWGLPKNLHGVRKVDDVTINFMPRRSRFIEKCCEERIKILQEMRVPGVRTFPVATDNVSLVVCHAKAVNPLDCFQQCDDALSSELGIFTFLLTSPHSYRLSFGNRKHIARILIAPGTTVHKVNGSLAYEGFWYGDFLNDLSPSKFDRDEVSKMISNYDIVRKSLSRLPWRLRAREALTRYQRSLSQTDLEQGFLDTWRLFELIAGQERDKYAQLVDRAASHWRETKYIQELGKHLIYRRNEISHGRAKRYGDDEGLVFQMIKLLHPLLKSFLLNHRKFDTLAEFYDFCDGPYEQSEISRKLYVLQQLQNFRRDK